MIIGKVRNFSEAEEREYSVTELVQMAYSEGYEAAQREFGAVKAANKAAKKAWEQGIGDKAMDSFIRSSRGVGYTVSGTSGSHHIGRLMNRSKITSDNPVHRAIYANSAGGKLYKDFDKKELARTRKDFKTPNYDGKKPGLLQRIKDIGKLD